MNKQAVNEWVKELRRGRYKQGQGTLRNVITDERCCLGVACDVFMPSKWHKAEMIDQWQIRTRTSRHSGVLPVNLAYLLGIGESGTVRVYPAMEEIPDKWAMIEPVLARYPGASKLWDVAKDMVRNDLWAKSTGYANVSLTHLNDDYRFTFSEIADILEAAMEIPDALDFEPGYLEMKKGMDFYRAFEAGEIDEAEKYLPRQEREVTA